MISLPTAGAQTPVDPEAYDLNISKGVVEFGKGHYEQAEALFTQALMAKPGDPDAQYYLGQTLIRTKKFTAAELIFRDMLQADPTSGRALLGLGISQYSLGHYRDALTSLTAAEKVLPDDPLVYFYQGLTYHELEDFEQSPGRFLRAMTLSPDLAPIAQYYSGVAYYRRGVLDEARIAFESAIALQPESEEAQAARELLAETPRAAPAGPRRWSLSFHVGSEWDSNVVLVPQGTQPPGGSTGISKQHDYRTVLSASGDFRAIQTETWTVGASYGIYQSFHRTLSGFDVEDHSPTFYVQHQVGPLRISLQYVYNYTLVGRSPYLISHAAQSLFTLTEGSRTFTQFQLRYQNKDFQDGRFPLNSARDGKNWLAGVTQYLLFADNKGRARVGYTYDTDNTGGGSPTVASPAGTLENADWAYTAHRISAGLEVPPIWTMNLDLAFDYYRQNYKNPNTFSVDGLTRRKDNIYAFTGTLSRNIAKNLSAALQYSYIRDQNNIDVFDYNRNIYSLILTWWF
ncbi:MAG: tetratricopeptide repeat protein [Nitrospirae bacterium]|nr:tetratricopeptide repeat protein [Nitrospirota bacterium]